MLTTASEQEMVLSPISLHLDFFYERQHNMVARSTTLPTPRTVPAMVGNLPDFSVPQFLHL